MKRPDGSIAWRHLPIHEACIHHPPESAISAILDAFPMGARSTDSYGQLPLHHACLHGASEGVILKLIMAYPEAIDMTDKRGKTPLMSAQESKSENKEKVVALLEKRPSYYAVKFVESRQKDTEEKQRRAFSGAFEDTFNEHNKKHASITANLEKKIEDFNSQIEDLTSVLKGMRFENRNLEEEESRLSLVYSELSGKADEDLSVISLLAQKMSSVKQELTEKSEDLEGTEGMISKFQRNEEHGIKIISSLKRNMAENNDFSENIVARLKASLTILTEKSDAAMACSISSRSGMEEEMASVQTHIKSLACRNFELDEIIACDKVRIAPMKSTLKSKADLISTLEKCIEECKKNYDKLNYEVEVFFDEIELLSMNNEQLEYKTEQDLVLIAALEGKATVEKFEVESLEKTVSEIKEKNQIIEEEKTGATKVIKKQTVQVEEQMSIIAKQVGDINELEENALADREKILRFEVAVQELTRTNVDLEKAEALLSETLREGSNAFKLISEEHEYFQQIVLEII